eukprot:m.279647 g.279647  ORF g.279647 m.279647 type:complete len:106 (-) comp11103_c6_seq18:1406-1723(-)
MSGVRLRQAVPIHIILAQASGLHFAPCPVCSDILFGYLLISLLSAPARHEDASKWCASRFLCCLPNIFSLACSTAPSTYTPPEQALMLNPLPFLLFGRSSTLFPF